MPIPGSVSRVPATQPVRATTVCRTDPPRRLRVRATACLSAEVDPTMGASSHELGRRPVESETITRELRSRVRADGRPDVPPDELGLIDYCSRPSCRNEFRRGPGPGRRQAYCSEICRRAAERELRQARSRLAHFENLVDKLRIDVAAYGRPDSDDIPGEEDAGLASRRVAEDAVRRAAGALEFANPEEPAVREFRRLYEAVAPIILSSTSSL
jgi:hypothetical protein